MSAARKRAYDSTTHCAPETVACSACWILGKATFTTVPSMKAILDPRIAAARTQPPWAAVPEEACTVESDCSTESQGYFNADSCHENRTTNALTPMPSLCPRMQTKILAHEKIQVILMLALNHCESLPDGL